MIKQLLTLILLTFLVGQLYAQVTITGQVKDVQGEPIPGVNVMVKGTTQGTITDLDGNYKISNVPSDGILVFSFIGMLTQEITVGGQTSINITLEEDVTGLDEVVVIGYGTVKKRDLTGAVSSVKATDIVKAPTYNVLEAIQGMVPGMDITRESGSAGSGVNIMLRGTRSIGDPEDEDSYKDLNEPLYIIDGIQGGSISDLNPNDIESIEVLKDASSTAIYGFQGANGVVIVTTKRGKTGQPRVSYNMYYGVNGYTSYPEVRMGDDYINLRIAAYENGGSDTIRGPEDYYRLFTKTAEFAAYDTGNWVNWPDLLIHNGHQQSHQISITSGNENTNSYLSVGYFKEEGILKMDEMKRYTARLNIDHKINKWANAGLNAQVTYTDKDSRKDPLSKALSLAPFGVPFNEDGSINEDPLGNLTSINPLTDERPNVAVDQNISTNVLTQGYFEIIPLKGLSLKTNLGTTFDFNRRGKYNDETSLARTGLGGTTSSITTNNTRFLNWDNVINYNKDIGNHNFNVTVLSSYTQRAYDMVYAGGEDQANASALFYLLESNETQSISSDYTGSKTLSYAGRLNYSYSGKYLLTVTDRYDWASMLSSGSRWEDFPSVALAWRISDESFMQTLGFLNDLKIRWSYGSTGNSNIKPYSTQSGINSFVTGFGDVMAIAYRFNSMIGNNSVGWEKTKTTNYGLDIGVLNNRLSASVDFYLSKTSDILLPRDLPTLSGVSQITQNVGKTENQGFEFIINSYNIQASDFTWKTTITYSHNQGKIVELVDGNDIISKEETSLFIGKPLRVFYTYDKLGIWQLGEEEEAAIYECEPGDIKVADHNKNGIIDEGDRVCYKRSPDWIGGLQNVFTYKSIDLSIYMFARVGQVINAEFLGRYNPSGEGNSPAYLDYWTPTNPTNDFPRPEWGGELSSLTGYQALTYVDGSYFKIKNVTLGYTLPQDFTRKFLVERLKVYGTLSNIYTKARSHLIQYYDPERGGAEKAPLSKQLVFGVNVDF